MSRGREVFFERGVNRGRFRISHTYRGQHDTIIRDKDKPGLSKAQGNAILHTEIRNQPMTCELYGKRPFIILEFILANTSVHNYKLGC